MALSLKEQAALEVFKRQLERQRIQQAGAAVDQQRIAKHGGERAIAQKQQAQAVFSENQHRRSDK